MEEASKKSKEMWTFANETLNIDKLNNKSAELEKNELLKDGKEIPKYMEQAIPQNFIYLEKNQPERMFNPFDKLKVEFDTVQDTPVEVLHIYIPGAVKYLFQDFMKGLEKFQREKLLALWYSLNKNSLNIPSIRPTSMIQYSRIILQETPFIFFQFMTPSNIKIWSSLCHMGSLIFQTQTDNISEYISDLKNHIDSHSKFGPMDQQAQIPHVFQNPIFDLLDVLEDLKKLYPSPIQQISELNLKSKQVLMKDHFILVWRSHFFPRPTLSTTKKLI
ncbi:hypothetical protein VP01_1163g3 [Puccinia sorghi]|uniref:Uncharacterized protein n=1 Tax=Puccinia sorghi TaxID=27349 RepID=A0A0L6VRE7_9BASI|nr:hypothetical protein VP01_1163g3 [Puccinia sorghi]